MAARAREPRRRSIRAMLALLFIVPLVSLLALWAFAASVTLINAVREHNYTSENRHYGGAAQVLGLQLAQERSQVFVWLSSGAKAPFGPLITQRKATNAAVTSFERGANAGNVPGQARPALSRFLTALTTLNSVRAKVDARQMSALQAFSAYNAIIDSQFQFYNQLVAVNDAALFQQGMASMQAGRALEMIDREVTLVNGALASGGKMNKSERLMFAQDVGNQRLLIDEAFDQFWPDLAAGYRSVYTSPEYRLFSAMENRIVASVGNGGRVPVTTAQWSTASFSVLASFDHAEQTDRMLLARAGTRVGDRLLLEVVLAAGLGLVAVVLSIFLMASFGRRISRELTGLQRSALDLATARLPQVVALLSHGEDVDQAALAGPGSQARIAEIARVAEAFTAVQQTAIEAAAGQARLRRGVSQVFRNLAWRSQALLHRQLALLDRMERRTNDPGTLEELFQLDHLTTRMRRHAEGLIILSGEPPGRGWRNPVPVVDVLRAAVAEVEDYTRVTVLTSSSDALVGAAVADVIHMLAELIENATSNSPPNTEVTVRADRVAHGIAVEIEDRGLGMNEQDMRAANERLADPPEFDLADSDKLGFFVIARLAARHHIRITLRPSPYGGLAAIVLLPNAIAVTDDADLSVGGFADRLELPPPADWLHGPAVQESARWGEGDRALGSGEFDFSGEASGAAAAPGPGGSRTAAAVSEADDMTDVLSRVEDPAEAEPVAAEPANTEPADTEPADTELADMETASHAQPTPAPGREAGTEDLLGLPRRVRGAELPAEPPGREPRQTVGSAGLPRRQSLAQPEGIPSREGQPRRGVAVPTPGSTADGEPDQAPRTATPEELGSFASSLQRGWLDGRSEADQPAD